MIGSTNLSNNSGIYEGPNYKRAMNSMNLKFFMYEGF